MVRRGFRAEAERLAKRVTKRTKKTDGLDVTLDELNEAEYEGGFPLQPTAARLFRRYRGIADAISELTASSKPFKAGRSKESEAPVKTSPTRVPEFLVPYSAGRTQTIWAKLTALSHGLAKGKGDLRKIVTFLRGINRELEKAIGQPIPWSVVPDADCVEMIQTGPSGSLGGLTTSPPPDLGEQLRQKGKIAGLVEVWRRVGELVLLYEKPKKFFETYAPELTPLLFDPDQLNGRVEPPGTLGRCLFVWGPSALLNPVVREAFDSAAGRGMAFQEAITTATGRSSYREGRKPGRHGRKPETVDEDRRRNKLVEAITYLGKADRFRTAKDTSAHMNFLKRQGCWAQVEPLVGMAISYRKAYEIVGKHCGVTASAIKKSCSMFSEEEPVSGRPS